MYSQTRQSADFPYIFAKTVRIVTVPPTMAFMLLFLVRNFSNIYVFKSTQDYFMAVFSLCILPFLAYPLSYLNANLRKKGREGQRNLAFVTCVIGYTFSMFYGILVDSTNYLMLIFLTYFLSVIALCVFNKVLKIRASGHACSMCGPLLLSIYFIGSDFVFLSLAIFALIIWASLKTSQHTLRELSLGTLCASVSFISASFLINLAEFLTNSGFIR